uniref:Uncharacterized protein n=1 Tax=Seriola lalandi dorsalis TaxID=1841481 RepID=A0A3B4YKJ8_SERLL
RKFFLGDLTNHICGITNGGKPTLTNCCVVHQDDFFNTITNTLDTEIVPKSDHKEKETHICHVEGFLSSTYGPIIEVLNQHYLISISYKDCKKRTYFLFCWFWPILSQIDSDCHCSKEKTLNLKYFNQLYYIISKSEVF